MKGQPGPGWPSTGSAHESARWPGRRPARSWCAAGRAPLRLGPRRVACAPQPPTSVGPLEPHEDECPTPNTQLKADELLVRDGWAADDASSVATRWIVEGD